MTGRSKCKYGIFALIICGVVLSGLVGVVGQIVPVVAASSAIPIT